jgi:hypothetical protein
MRPAVLALALAGCGTVLGLDDLVYDREPPGPGPTSSSSAGGNGGGGGGAGPTTGGAGGSGGQGGVGNAQVVLDDHPKGQVLDSFGAEGAHDDLLVFRFRVEPLDGSVVDGLALAVTQPSGDPGASQARLFVDDGPLPGALDGGDTEIATGTITTSAIAFEGLTLSTTTDCLVTLDCAHVDPGDAATLDLLPTDVTATIGGDAAIVGGQVTAVRHERLGGDLLPGDVRLVYRDAAGGSVDHRFYDGDWSGPEVVGQPLGTVRWVATTPELSGDTQIAGVLADDGGTARLDVFRFDGSAWSLDWSASDVGVTDTRAFDVAEEAASRNVVCVYTRGDLELRYRVLFGGSGWSAEGIVPGVTDVSWARLVSQPGTNEIALGVSEVDSDYKVLFWDGAAWGTATLFSNALNRLDFENFALAYEPSGDLLSVWAEPVNEFDGFFWAARPLGSAFGSANFDAGFTKPGPISLAPEPGDDRIAVAHIEHSCNGDTCDNFEAGMWDGADMTAQIVVDGAIDESYGARPGTQPVAAAWAGTFAVAIYVNGAGGPLDWARFDGGLWSSQAPAAVSPNVTGDPVNVHGISRGSQALFVFSDEAGQLWAKSTNGTTWTDTEGGSTLGQIGLTEAHPFAVTVRR